MRLLCRFGIHKNLTYLMSGYHELCSECKAVIHHCGGNCNFGAFYEEPPVPKPPKRKGSSKPFDYGIVFFDN